MPEFAKDVMLAVLGASVGLAGLLLVFSGFVLSQASSFPPTTDDEVIERFEKAGRFGVWPFLFAIVIALLSVAWFTHPCPGIYWSALVGFIVLLVATAFYGAVLFWSYL